MYSIEELKRLRGKVRTAPVYSDKWCYEVRDEAMVINGLTSDMVSRVEDITRHEFSRFTLHPGRCLGVDPEPVLSSDTLWGLLMAVDAVGVEGEAYILGHPVDLGDSVLVGQFLDGGRGLYLDVISVPSGEMYLGDVMTAYNVFRYHRQYLAGTYQFEHYDEAVLCASEMADAFADGRAYLEELTFVPGLHGSFVG